MNSFCMNCGIELPKGASFCPKCGAKVEAPHCPSCGKKVDFGADFCIYCGHPLTGREEGVFTPAESPELNPTPEALNTPPAPVQPVSEIPPVLVQPVKEVPRGDDVQEFSWSYFKLGFTNFSNHRHNITATLTKEKLHIAEQRRWGWKPKTEETDIALMDVTELCIRSKASAPYWVLYSALATACLFAIYAGVLDVATCVILALVVGVSIWIASFNLLHNEFVILTRDNKKTVLKGAKEAVFQQLEQEISSRTEVRIGEAQSAALTIFISISVGIIATGAALLLLGGRIAMPTIAKDDLIGRWDLQYMENDGEIYSYDFLLAQGYTTNEINLFFHSVYIQFFEDGFFELTAAYEDETPEQVYGTWAIKGSRIVIVSDSTTIEGYLHDGLLCMESEDSTMRFERVSATPTKIPERYEPSASLLTDTDLIGCWQFRYVQFNTGETLTYEDAEYEFLRIYSNGSYSYTREDPSDSIGIGGDWFIKDDAAVLQDWAESDRGAPGSRTIRLEDGKLYLRTSEKESQFEKLSGDPDYWPDYETYATPQPSIALPTAPSTASPTVPGALYKVMSENTLFSVRAGYYNEYSETTEFDDSSEIDVMSCDSIFIYYGDPEPVRYDTQSFAVVDMDEDGEAEVVLFGDSGFDGLYTVLHVYEGTVYGYTMHFRGMAPLYANGLFEGSGGAAESYVSKFEFHGADALAWNVAYANWDNSSFYIYETQISEEAYTNYLTEMGCYSGNEAVFYDYTDENIQRLLAP